MLQPGRPVLGELEQAADVLAIPGPSLARDQVRLGVGEPAAGLQPDVAGPQRGPEFPEHAQLVVVTVDLAVLADDVGTPPGRDELDRGVRRHLPLPPGVQVAEPVDGLEDRGPGPVGPEREGVEELRRELAEVVVAVGQEVELVVVPATGQGLGPLHGLAERLPGDLAVDRRPQLAVGDRRVEHDAADLAEQPDRLVGRLGVRQAELLQLPLGPCRRPGQAAVEQVDDLVGGLLQGLAEERDEDGVPPLGRGPLQGLVGRPLAQPGQELEPVGVERPEVPAVDPPADQGGPPFQGGEDRGGGGGDLPLPEPGQEGPVRRLVGDEQAVQERAPRFVQHGGEPLHRLALGTAACGDDHPLQDGDPGPHDLVGGELLARQLPEQQGAVVLQGPVEQPAGQLLSLLGARLAVSQVVLDGEEVVGAGLRPPAVGGQPLGGDLQLVGQEADHLGGAVPRSSGQNPR